MHIAYPGRANKSYRIMKAFENQTGYVWLLSPVKLIARWNKNHPIIGRIHVQYDATWKLKESKVKDD